jgi:zinc-binding alcohol dehydrogenase/oxidoreductase
VGHDRPVLGRAGEHPSDQHGLGDFHLEPDFTATPAFPYALTPITLARGGAYVTPGATTGPDATTDLARLFWNQLRFIGTTMGSNDEFRSVAHLLRRGALGVVVDSVFDAADAVKAYQRLEAAEQFGKIVLRWE